MNYKVLIAKPVQDSIASWGLPRAVLLEVYHRLLVVLPSDPDRHLGEIVFPFLARQYAFVLHLEMGLPLPFLYRFVFVIEKDDEKQELRVVGCAGPREEPDTN